jgi:signal transduction histidine kinase
MKYFPYKLDSYNAPATIAGLVVLASNYFLFSLIFLPVKSVRVISLATFLAFLSLSLFLVWDVYMYIYDKSLLSTTIQKDKQLREQLVGLQKKKIELESDVSTEIRTPLQVIRGYASMLVDGSLGTLGGSTRKVAENILSQSKKANTLADRIIGMPLAVLSDNDLKNIKNNKTSHYFLGDKLTTPKFTIFYILALCAFLGTLAQIFLASSFAGLLLALGTSFVCAAVSLFILNEMNHESKSLGMVMQLTNDLSMVSRELEALQREMMQSFVQIETDIRGPLDAIKKDAQELSLDTTDGISTEAKEVAKKIFELSESLGMRVADLVSSHNSVVNK